MQKLRILIVLLAIAALPEVGRPDLPPPPALKETHPRYQNLNAALERLAREQGVPVRVLYVDVDHVDIANLRTMVKLSVSTSSGTRASLMRSGGHKKRREVPFQAIRSTEQTSRTALASENEV